MLLWYNVMHCTYSLAFHHGGSIGSEPEILYLWPWTLCHRLCYENVKVFSWLWLHVGSIMLSLYWFWIPCSFGSGDGLVNLAGETTQSIGRKHVNTKFTTNKNHFLYGPVAPYCLLNSQIILMEMEAWLEKLQMIVGLEHSNLTLHHMPDFNRILMHLVSNFNGSKTR